MPTLDGMAIPPSISVAPWGTTPLGQPVQMFTLLNDTLTVRLVSFGARLVGLQAPDRDGNKADVVLGYGDLAGYLADTKSYLGAVVGRYGNRIAKGTFALDGETYHVPTNNGGNALHGGTDGFDRKVWAGRVLAAATAGEQGVEFTLKSPDGDMGFPGELTARVRYLLDGNALHVVYEATTTRPTVVNLTQHSYFNLAGEASGDVLGHEVMLAAERFTPVSATLIPTGDQAPVRGTAFDFSEAKAIGRDLHAADDQLRFAGGYDHNFVLNEAIDGLRLAAKVFEPATGRTLLVRTAAPGVQFYSGNFLDGSTIGVSGKPYAKHAGFCLETQHFPDSPNQPQFPTTTLRPGETLRSETVFAFGVA